MASEIASAFVRIRPNMSGFKSETERGVRSAFSGIAKIAGVAFGAAEAFRFGKSILSDAAGLQKSMEVVNAEFGRGAEQIHNFAENAGIGLGITSHLTEQTAARFGILFQNLGIGQQQAAGMTVGLLKLAGSLSAIRGVDPATVMERLPLAIAGNLRSLKQLGVAVDANQIKFAALKLGLISTLKDAITPSIRAQAIYALATANLGKFQEQAKKHAGDFVNVQRRLSAEWDRAKEVLGTALLPIFTKYARELERWFSRMSKSGALQRDFNKIAQTTATVVKTVANVVGTGWRIFQTAAGWIGGVKVAAAALFAVLAERKIIAIGKAISTHMSNPISNLKTSFRAAKGESEGAFATMRAGAIATGVTIRTALIETGIGLLIVAIGIAVGYIVTHWDTVKRYTVALAKGLAATWGGLKTTLLGIAEEIGGGMATFLTLPLRAFLEIADKITGKLAGVGIFGFHPFAGPHKLIAGALEGLKAGTTDLAGKGAKNVEKGFSQIGDAFGKAWTKALADTSASDSSRAKVKAAGKKIGESLTAGVTDAVAKVPGNVATKISDAMRLALEAAQRRIAAAVAAAKDNLDKIGGKLADSVNKILDKLGPAGPAGRSQKAAIAKLQKLIESGAPGFAITRASQELSSDLSSAGRQNAQDKTARHAAVKASIANLTDEFNRGKISLATFNKDVTRLLRKDKVSYKIAGKELGQAFADGFRSQVAALHEQAAALAAVPKSLRGIGGGGGSSDIKIIRPLETIRRENRIIGDKAAKQRERQIKAQERTAKAAEKVAQQTKVLGQTKVGKLPGDGSKKASDNAKAGVKP